MNGLAVIKLTFLHSVNRGSLRSVEQNWAALRDLKLEEHGLLVLGGMEQLSKDRNIDYVSRLVNN